MLKLILPSSPSLTLSTPHSICFFTTSCTPFLSAASSAGLSNSLPSARAVISACRPSGRGRLPAWVVRIRSLLRFIESPIPVWKALFHQLAHQARRFLLLILQRLGLADEIAIEPARIERPLGRARRHVAAPAVELHGLHQRPLHIAAEQPIDEQNGGVGMR